MKEKNKKEEMRKEKVKIALELLQKEQEYEISRSRNFENKSYIALGVLFFLFTKNYNVFNENENKIINFLLENNLEMEFFRMIIYILFLIMSIISLSYFLSVINIIKICRLSTNIYKKKYMNDSKTSVSKYFCGIKDEMIKSINETREILEKKEKKYDRGLKFLKIALGTFFLIIILGVIK